jgi:hypothetical protein
MIRTSRIVQEDSMKAVRIVWLAVLALVPTAALAATSTSGGGCPLGLCPFC